MKSKMLSAVHHEQADDKARLLLTMTQAISAADNLHAALDAVLRLVCQASGWTLGQAWVPRPEGTLLECSPAWYHAGPETDQFRAASEKLIYPRDIGLPGTVYASKRPLWIPDIGEEVNFPRVELAREAGLKAAMGIPVLAGSDVVAILEFFVRQPRSADERLIHLISAVAAQLGGVMRQKRAEEKLRESEERFRQLAEHIEDVLWISNPNTTEVLYISPAYETIWGRTCSSLYECPRSFMDCVHPDDRASVSQAVLLHSHHASDVEYRIIRPDGSTRWIRDRGYPVKTPAGETLRVVGIAEDITTQKMTEEAFKESERKFKLLFEKSTDANVLLDGEYFIDCNQAAVDLLGLTNQAQLLSLHPTEISPEFQPNGRPSSDKAAEIFAEIYAKGSLRFEWHYRRIGGEVFPVEILATVIPLNGRKLLHTVWRDITDRKRLEDQFRQAQKMEAIGQLAGGVAHDFNNLLTVISGYSEILLANPSYDAHTSRELVVEIKKAGDRAASLTRQLLAYSRKQVLVPRDLDVNLLIVDMEKMLRRLIGEDVELVTRLQSTVGTVKADPGQIHQVIMNLVVNARDAMPHGGVLTIETSNADIDESLNGAKPDNLPFGKYTLLAVHDTGTGMDAHARAHLFEPFFTTKEVGKGTGLGLAAVYGIIKQSSGFMYVDSELGQGTTFKIYLPLHSDSAPAPEVTALTADNRLGTETVLVAEDEEKVRDLVQDILCRQGYQVLEARHGIDALRLCEAHEGPIHLLLTDVIMPHMSGPQLAQRVGGMRPETKVLYVSGYTDDAVLRNGISQAETPFLQKPFSPHSLVRKVREVLDS